MQNWRLPTVHIRRYTLRPDGFVSVQAGYHGGSVTTRLMRFTGSELRLNYATSAVGSIKVEALDTAGQAIPGYTRDDCRLMYGDLLDGPVLWQGGREVRALANRPLRLRFYLRDADLYAFRFHREK
jgi:hypothetical protein